MKLLVLLILVCLTQTSGQALNNFTLNLITAFTEQTRVTSAVFFFCWSPAGKNTGRFFCHVRRKFNEQL
jgi:hypothetical protein